MICRRVGKRGVEDLEGCFLGRVGGIDETAGGGEAPSVCIVISGKSRMFERASTGVREYQCMYSTTSTRIAPGFSSQQTRELSIGRNVSPFNFQHET